MILSLMLFCLATIIVSWKNRYWQLNVQLQIYMLVCVWYSEPDLLFIILMLISNSADFFFFIKGGGGGGVLSESAIVFFLLHTILIISAFKNPLSVHLYHAVCSLSKKK